MDTEFEIGKYYMMYDCREVVRLLSARKNSNNDNYTCTFRYTAYSSQFTDFYCNRSNYVRLYGEQDELETDTCHV